MLSQLQYGNIYEEAFFFFLLETDDFFEFLCIFKEKLKKNKFSEDIWRLFQVLAVSFHHKWNSTRVSSAEKECKDCLTSSKMTWDLGSQ